MTPVPELMGPPEANLKSDAGEREREALRRKLQYSGGMSNALLSSRRERRTPQISRVLSLVATFSSLGDCVTEQNLASPSQPYLPPRRLTQLTIMVFVHEVFAHRCYGLETVAVGPPWNPATRTDVLRTHGLRMYDHVRFTCLVIYYAPHARARPLCPSIR